MSARAHNTLIHRGVACLLAGGCLLAVTACGSDSRAAQGILGRGLRPAGRVHSGRIALSIALAGPPAGAATVSLAGPFTATGAGGLPRFALTARLVRGGVTRSLGVTSTGGQLFVRVAGAAYLAPARQLAELRRGYAGGGAPGFALDPTRWLVRPVRVGSAVLDGVRTEHIRAGVDDARVSVDLRRLQGELGAVLGIETTSTAVTGGRADVYIGASDHLLRELSLRTTGGAPLTALISLTDVNRPQDITAPAHAQPFAGLLTALAGAPARPGPARPR